MKNAYVGRTFIQPSQTIRQLGIRLKLNPLREVIAGKRLVVVDDSIVRGNTQRALVADAARGRRGRGARADLVAAGAVAVLLRHRLRHPRRADRQRADASRRSRTSIGADSLGYISLEGMIAATEPAARAGCAAPASRRVPDRAARRRAAAASTLLATEPLLGRRHGLADADRSGRAADVARPPWSSRDATPDSRYAAAGRRHRGRRPRRRADEGRGRARPHGPRCSAASAGSPGCSTPARCATTAARCWPPPPTASAPRSRSPSAMDVHDTIGIDLVAMVVDDLVVCGAEPLFMTDYIACGKVVPERIAAIVSGHRRGLRAGRRRAGGRRDRRAPGPARPGRVRRGRGRRPAWSRPTRCSARTGSRAGDVVVAMASSGLHSNGYSLVRHVLLERRRAGRSSRRSPELGRTLGEELLEPTRIYARGLPGPGRRGAEVHALRAHHRRRARGEPGAGAARGPGRHAWTAPAGRRPPVFDLVAPAR